MRNYQASDYPTISGWAYDRGVEIAPNEYLPKVGFISDTAVCFLVSTDTPVCFIEYLIAAKTALPDNIEEVINACCREAGKLGFKVIRAYTEMSSVRNRALKMGFSLVSEQNKILELGVV